jgi:hypothetical protein
VIQDSKAEDDVAILHLFNDFKDVARDELVLFLWNTVMLHVGTSLLHQARSELDSHDSGRTILQSGETEPAIVAGEIEYRRSLNEFAIRVDNP